MSRSAAHDARNRRYREALTDSATIKAVSIPTARRIENDAKELGVRWEAEDVPDGQGGRIHWVGDRAAKKVILYFHGGGFGLPMLGGNVIFFVQCQQKLAEKGRNVVLAFVEYGLTPEIKYPTQYAQGVQALWHILSSDYEPSDVVIGGGSAGGNLALGIISSLLHPHSGIPSLTLPSPLKGTFLISPGVSFSTDAISFEENKDKDMFTAESSTALANQFVTPAERDNYSEPILAETDWWKDAPVDNVLLVCGDLEMFRDDNRAFANTLEKAGLNVEFVNCPLQVHVDCILDAGSGMEPGLMSTTIWDWFNKIF